MAARTCGFRKENGEPCRAAPLQDSQFCFWHSPEHAEDAVEARRLGGFRRRRERTTSGAYDFDELTNASLARYIAMHTREPIIRSEPEQRITEARAEMVPASELAEILADCCDGWTDGNQEADEEASGKAELTEAAWERALREKEREIAQLVKEAVLAGKGRGRRLLVNAGSFYDWLAEPVPVFPDWAEEYEVLPDDQAGMVELDHMARSHAQDVSRHAPRDLVLEAPASLMARIRERFLEQTGNSSSGGDDIAAALLMRLIQGVQEDSRELPAVELVVAEVASEFCGKDLLVPQLRDILDNIRHRLEEMRCEVQCYVGEFEVPEPAEDEVEMVKSILERAERLYL